MSEHTTQSDLHTLALKAGVFHVVEREAKSAKDAAKADLVALLPFGDAVAGRVGDQLLCKVGWSKGTQKVVVTDDAAFLTWVREHHPSEIVESVNPDFDKQQFLAWVKEHHPDQVVESVNPAYVNALKVVGAVLVDAHGEVASGVEVQTGSPSLSVRSEKNALELVAQLVADGRVSLNGIKELATSPATDADDDIIDAEVVV